MKRIQFFLFALIFTAIAAKVSIIPAKKTGYAVLSIDTKLDHVQEFFRYKVNNIQTDQKIVKHCVVRKPVCCHT
ncbi:hypothetical protein [Christiangramia sabulilitoris]|uniref:Uncharacterized protein n=1 Tax=Christiangramia sabulilitoris TaxID=2583991 RepID=A0A550I7G7_9FLAO|nr:hypothetical protein [Christiangramia sabulilitoris]TRO66916.1 hypothetical protein FGM01_03215 [Christiangramia sabulilitoris]